VSSIRNLKLTIAYDGSCYHGFQWQDNAISIQQILEERLAKIFGGGVKINGAARTDAGVHAYGQVISFRTASVIPAERITLACQGVLPPDIVVMAAEEVPPGFNARRDAKGKVYRYRLLNRKLADPLERNYSWHYRRHMLDAGKINEMLKTIVGKHDFAAFKAAGGATMTSVRTIFSATCFREGDFVVFEFWGNGFLYHMVRNLVGTLVDTDREFTSAADAVREFQKIIDGKDRHAAGVTAPAQGLYLVEVRY
jgi:tRNA pseudouridine38-40 synthase